MKNYLVSPLSIAIWQKECVVFNHLSGETHLMSDEFMGFFEVISKRTQFSYAELINNFDLSEELLSENILKSSIKEFLRLGIIKYTISV